MVALGAGFIFYNQMILDKYAPADDKIPLHIQFDQIKILYYSFMIIVQVVINMAEVHQMWTERQSSMILILW